MSARLGIVVPCYNEDEVILDTKERLLEELEALTQAGKVSPESFVCFVDDGSMDRTWEMIEAFCLSSPRVKGIRLSRNFGHQAALRAGYTTLAPDVDCCVSIDADLQDDPAVIGEFLDRFHEGFDVVYGVRNDRGTDSAFKRLTARAFYGFMRMMGSEVVADHADFRLLGKKALVAFDAYGEVNLFLRGMVPLMGFRSTRVYYERKERTAGETKYPLRRMVSFAVDGITSFSVVPLRVVTVVGLVVFLASCAMGVYAVVGRISGNVVPGWASTVLPIYFLGGIQMLFIGLIGEYLGKIYKEVKRRPSYFIEQTLLKSDDANELRRVR